MTAYCLGSLLYEGKAKRVYATDRPDLVAVEFKDDATAFDALKKAELAGKGELNCQISARLFEYLAARGVPTHYLGVGDTRWMLVRPVRVIPVEVVIRNVAAGSLCKQMPIELGTCLEPALLDLYYKDDAYGDPLLTEARLELLGLVNSDQRRRLEELARQVNRELMALFSSIGLQLMFCNTYHLLLQPGPDVIAKGGGIHRFINRNMPIITDSGGFQVFSLMHGSVHNELKSKGKKSDMKNLRKQGLIPAVIYGEGKEGLMINLDKVSFMKKYIQ